MKQIEIKLSYETKKELYYKLSMLMVSRKILVDYLLVSSKFRTEPEKFAESWIKYYILGDDKSMDFMVASFISMLRELGHE